MQKITKRSEVSRAAVIVPLTSKLKQLYVNRISSISRMSGYPSAIHSIGRLQRMIDLSSFEALLKSLVKIYNIAHTTAEVIESMDGTKVDRYQLNRTEIVAYVTNITQTLKNFEASQDDIDLIAHLITSFEASPAAWILLGGDSDDDLHSKFQKLYKEVLIEADGSDLAVYAAHKDSITHMGELESIQEIVRNAKPKSRKGKKVAEEEAPSDEILEDIENVYTMYRFACARIIDHVYQLLLDKDVWYSFVAPRIKADVMTNLERAKTLKVFALYCQSLLTYNQFFTLEMFLKSYDLVQEWIAHFPSLEEVAIKKLEGTIRNHDFLGARADVNALIDSLSSSAREDLKALVFPKEFLAKFGLTLTIQQLTDKVGEYTLSGDLSNIKDLDNPRYLPLVSGVAASTFNVAYDLANILLMGKVVSKEIDRALAGLVPSMTRGSGRASVDGLKALNIKCSIPFVAPHAVTYEVEAGVDKGLRGGVLFLDSAAPQFSYDYHKFIRDEVKFRMTTDRQVALAYQNFQDVQVVDYDKARELREILAYEWRSFVPSSWHQGERVMKPEYLIGNPDNVRYLIEQISGINYEIAIREMALPHLRQIWATYVSSFALIYVNPSDITPLTKIAGIKNREVNPVNYQLVEGHGRPYGTTYSKLEQLQGVLNADTVLIPIGNGIFLRFLTKIPIVTDDIQVDSAAFYAQRPVIYFASNSSTQEVTEWVLHEGLLNFSLIPTSTPQFVPAVKFTPKYAFLTQNLYLNMNLYYKPVAPEKARETYDTSVVTSDWPFDRHQFFLEYRHFGKYSSPVMNVGIPEESELLADTIKKIEKTITEDVKQEAKHGQEAGQATKKAADEVTKEIKEELQDAPESKLGETGDQVTI